MALRDKRPKDITKISTKILANIMRASEIDDKYKILVYGAPKKGKTRLMATLPNVLIIDCGDRGTRSTRRDLDPNVYHVNVLTDMDDLYWFLAEGDHQFESVAIDGVTGLQTLALQFVLNDMAVRDATRDPNMPSKQSWGKANKLVKDYITNYKNLPLNVGFTALERSRDEAEDDEEESHIVIGPAVSPGVASHLEGAVGTIGRLTAKEVRVKKRGAKTATTVIRRELFVGSSDRVIAGDRDFVWGSVIRNPHLGKMIRQLEEGGQ